MACPSLFGTTSTPTLLLLLRLLPLLLTLSPTPTFSTRVNLTIPIFTTVLRTDLAVFAESEQAHLRGILVALQHAQSSPHFLANISTPLFDVAGRKHRIADAVAQLPSLPRVAAVFGPSFSDSTEFVQELIYPLHKPHMTALAARASLSDRVLYPDYYRAAQSAATVGRAAMELCAAQGWTHVVVLTHAGDLGDQYRDSVVQHAGTFNVSVVALVQVDNLDADDVQRALDEVVASGARVVVAWVGSEVMAAASARTLTGTGRVWIGLGMLPSVYTPEQVAGIVDRLVSVGPRAVATATDPSPLEQVFLDKFANASDALYPAPWVIPASVPPATPDALFAFEATLLFMNAINATIAAGGDPTNYTQLRPALLQATLDGSAARFSSNQELLSRVDIVQAIDGTVESLGSITRNGVSFSSPIRLPGDIAALPEGAIVDTCAGQTSQFRDTDFVCKPCPDGFVNDLSDGRDECVPRSTSEPVSAEVILASLGSLLILVIAGWIAMYIYQLRKEREVATNLAKQESAYAAFVYHELRNPLSAISSLLEFVHDTLNQDGPLDPPAVESITQDTNNALIAMDHATEVLDNVLDLARAAADTLEIKHEPVSLAYVVDKTLSIVSSHGTELPVYGKVVIAEDIKQLCSDERFALLVMSDSTRLRQVLLNLISNSLKFTPDGFVLLRVTVRRDRKSRTRRASTLKSSRIIPLHQVSICTDPEKRIAVTVRFEVCDTGAGLSPEQQERIFRKFDHADAHRGTGLGLVLSKMFVDKLGAESSIEIDSPWTPRPEDLVLHNEPLAPELGKGCRMHFTVRTEAHWGVPPKQRRRHRVHARMSTSRGISAQHFAVNASHLDPLSRSNMPTPVPHLMDASVVHGVGDLPRVLRVLVVDDLPLNRKVLARKLASSGPFAEYDWHIETAVHGEQALELHAQQPFDLIFMDQLMNVSGGVLLGSETVERIREREGDDECAVIIMVTGNASDDDRAMYLRAGADGVIAKPVPPAAELHERVVQVYTS